MPAECYVFWLQAQFDREDQGMGQGDFAGGFVGHLEKTQDFSFENMKRAVIYGSTTASFCVEQFGTERLKEITQDQIQRRKQNFIDLVSVEA